MKFSICIPNYNYGRYVAETIESVLGQDYENYEIIVSDNASTDNSREVLQSFHDPRVQLHVNNCNVGFSRNLDRAARRATGDRLILLSSDDLLRPDQLETYAALSSAIGSGVEHDVFTACVDNIASDGTHLQVLGRPRRHVWCEMDRHSQLDAVAGAPVYRVEGCELLRRCLLKMQNPFHFATTCYSRALYNQVEGYGGERMINPDKWFHWKLLSVCRYAYFIDRPLARYRTHDRNQESQQQSTGAVKFLLDEYAATFQLSDAALQRAGVSRSDLEKAFIHFDVIGGAMRAMANGSPGQARRVLAFGRATYPQHLRLNLEALAATWLARVGPLGGIAARRLLRTYTSG